MQISQLTQADMQYPLQEGIGSPELLVGHEEEFNKWIEGSE